MKKIKLKGLEMDVYTETLKNGFEVYLLPYANKKNYFMSYATRFGSTTTTFTPNDSNKEVSVPAGIAHFLEHKMFEQEDGVDPFTYYSESGTGANASTSYDNTQYICYGTKNFSENLRYLLHYVNHPYYTDENVSKEKGIITEELKMYEDIPEWQLEIKLRENIYHVHPRRVDLGGSVESIQKITKEDLYLCHRNFYVPNNMFLLIVGHFDPEVALKIVHEQLDSVPSIEKPKVKKIKEPKSVRMKEKTIFASVGTPKVGFGIKVPIKDFSSYDDLTLDLYLSMITTIIFGSSSLFRERVRNQKLLNSFYTEWETVEDYRVFYIIASTSDPEQLVHEIKEELQNFVIFEDSFTRMKKVWIANEVRIMDSIDAVVRNIYDDIIHYKKIIPDKMEQIRNLDFEQLNQIASKIDFKNMAIVQLLDEDKADKTKKSTKKKPMK